MTVLLSVVGKEKNQNVMQIYFDAWNLTDKSSAFSLSPFSSFFLFFKHSDFSAHIFHESVYALIGYLVEHHIFV